MDIKNYIALGMILHEFDWDSINPFHSTPIPAEHVERMTQAMNNPELHKSEAGIELAKKLGKKVGESPNIKDNIDLTKKTSNTSLSHDLLKYGAIGGGAYGLYKLGRNSKTDSPY